MRVDGGEVEDIDHSVISARGQDFEVSEHSHLKFVDLLFMSMEVVKEGQVLKVPD